MTHCLGSLASLSNASSARDADTCMAMRPRPVASSTLRIANPPSCERRVSVKTVHFSVFFAGIPTRFGNRKLAREGSVFARKRNTVDFLSGTSDFRRRRAALLRRISRFAPLHRSVTSDPLVEVPLDGAETKSEDCQRDVRRSAAQTPMIALN